MKTVRGARPILLLLALLALLTALPGAALANATNYQDTQVFDANAGGAPTRETGGVGGHD